ncbi:uncharacterized protein LOC108808148 [Raphanus sativus]|uniref:Uncharacterized protein LOC108808148 n=1 Tax=Raphanus sativus TaxID=3726 RepID=A0A9W3BV13_RAPSA|nr:uncharacterized protein LOC108808148 [Raphanus sativus]
MGYSDLFVSWIMRCIDTAAFSVFVNGELAGFFSSSRVIRQGCSLSPYIYVIVSNVLSKLHNKEATDGLLGHHPHCKELNLSHLSFVDDIVVFTNGSLDSLRNTLEVFHKFSSMSGLAINVAKSTVFAVGRGKQALEAAAGDSGLSISALPIKYLGLPLTTKLMNKNEYDPLITKIKKRFLSWTSKALSYAGRLQLIESVITSMTNFWLAAFCLPQACMDEIESMCSAFLWSGSPNNTSMSKVAWADVCCPFAEGGLGLRRVHEVVLVAGGDWDVTDTGLGSWVWRKILRVRTLAKKFIRMDIKNGQKVKFWTDLWLPAERLIDLAGEIGTQTLGITRNLQICEVFADGGWRFRICRDQHIQQLVEMIHQFPLSLTAHVPDGVFWRNGPGDYGDKFIASNTWQQIRQRKDEVQWSKIVWFPQGVPRFSFITWLVFRDRLSTGHRTSRWVSRKVVGNLFGMEPDPDWDITILHLTTGTYDQITFILLRLVLQVTIYYI